MKQIDEYLSQLSTADSEVLEQIRSTIHSGVPDVEETWSYGMPGFKYRGKYLAGFFAFKDHLSFFPTSAPVEKLADKLKDFKTSKGTVQFTTDKPIGQEIITELLLIRKKSIDDVLN